MASPDLEDAKNSIASAQEGDAQLDAALSDGRALQLELTREKNRYNEAMRKIDLGTIGRYIGGESTASLTVAFVVVVFGLLGCGVCWVTASFHADAAEFWSRQAERSVAIAMTALSYIFGKSATRTSR